MQIFKTGTAIGKTVAGRVRGFRVWEKLPKKMPRRKPTCWILCPDFKVKTPKAVTQAVSEKDYNFTVEIFSETRAECNKALDHMIRCGQENIEVGDKCFWLNAVTYGIQHQALFKAELTYNFRVRQIPDKKFYEEVN